MKELPIIFDAESMRSILSGTKTQTRRVIKPQPAQAELMTATCPYGVPGDRLWCKETWAPHPLDESDPPWRLLYKSDGANMIPEVQSSHIGGRWIHPPMQRGPINLDYPDWQPARWRSPIYMPRWASRCILEVVDTWPLRLGDMIDVELYPWSPDTWFWVIEFRRIEP